MSIIKTIKAFLFFTTVAVLFGCTSTKKAEPLIQDYLLQHISHPETYKPIGTTVVAKGTIDVANAQDWLHIPKGGIIKVVVLRHEFTHDSRYYDVIDNAYYFYMNPELDVLYYAHMDVGNSGPRYTLME